MTLTYGQLLGIRKQAQDTKNDLSSLWGMLLSMDLVSPEDLVEDIPAHPFESPQVRIDDTGHLCDDIIKHCTEQIHLLDGKQKRVKPETIAPKNCDGPTSRWG